MNYYAGGDNGTHFEFWEKHYPDQEIPPYSGICSNCHKSIHDNFFIRDGDGNFSVVGECCVQEFIQITSFTEGKYAGVSFEAVLKRDPGYMLRLDKVENKDDVIISAIKYVDAHLDEIEPYFVAGKYEGRSYESIFREDRNYFAWVIREKNKDPNYIDACIWYNSNSDENVFTSGKYTGQSFQKVATENPKYFTWLKENGKMPFATEWYDANISSSIDVPSQVKVEEPQREGAINFGKHSGKTLQEIWEVDKPYLYFIIRKLDYTSSKRFLIENTCDFLKEKLGKGDGVFMGGKYKGKTYEEVLEEDEPYFTWIRDGYTGKGEDFMRAWIWYLRR